MTAYRRAGSKWRLLVHDMAPKGRTSTSRSVLSHPTDRSRYPADLRAKTEAFEADMLAKGFVAPDVVLTGAEFDELVVGQWIHIEQMDAGLWWMNIGGVTVHVNADRDGRPRRVTIDGPGHYDDPRPGCTYELRAWTDVPSGSPQPPATPPPSSRTPESSTASTASASEQVKGSR